METLLTKKAPWIPILESATKKLSLPNEYVKEAIEMIELARGPKCYFLCASRKAKVLATIFLWLVIRRKGAILPRGLYAVAEACGSSYHSVERSWSEIRRKLAEFPEFSWIKSLAPVKRGGKRHLHN